MTSASSIAAPPKDSLGCMLSQLEEDRRIDSTGMTFYRKKAAASPSERIRTPATNRGYLIGVSLAAGHRRRILHEHHSTVHEFEENSVYVRNFNEDYRADLQGSFDFALLEISRGAIDRMSDGADLTNVSELRTGGRPDPVLGGLMAALFANTADQSERSALFVEQISVAISIHVAQQYGNGRPVSAAVEKIKGRRLSTRSVAIVQDLMRDRLDGDLSIEELARACNLSQGAFLGAFRETIGKTPYQWFVQQRVEKARDLLAFSPLSLGEIAVACGFADQSHFTRIFARATGAAPGAWRRTHRT
ncbi:helix-turn-helix domain-containing protein [Pararhizobium sp. BT-229]|uniref:AraC family transcriptional regulator n=1 Tax=Pararhizobium sp. BT-229 TaxID=2986923 RepID=UPI0021F76F5C|nr:helix-turn-helix domain-containing protein [Pararhizobium sp. BT-229]MCV9966348.1 helix-turn-helix domain-containing protein [Pararhizobium sp. BT-229]